MDLARQIDLNARFERFQPLVTRHNQQRQMSFSPLWEAFFRASDPGFTRQPVKVLFPFFDIRLVELMLRVPPDPWCRSKFLLREAMRGALPERVRQRPKVTLHDFPEPRYLYPNGAPVWMHELAAYPALAQYVNVPLLQNTLNQPQSMTTAGFRLLTTRLAFAYWLHHLGEPI